MNKIIQKAYDIAKEKHRGQTDRAGVDYFSGHILAVFDGVCGWSADPKIAATALLHDVVEDTDITIEELNPMFGSEISDAVNLLTKKRSFDGTLFN